VLLDNYLSKLDEPEDIEYYFCGPPVMNNAVVKMLDSLGIPQRTLHLTTSGYRKPGSVSSVIRKDTWEYLQVLLYTDESYYKDSSIVRHHGCHTVLVHLT
jgi:ferredoxin-NADP reductase